MGQALRFLIQFEAVLYFVIAIIAILYLYRFWTAWQEIQSAIYGLEREAAQARLNQTSIVLFVLLALAIIVFSVVTFVAPTVPAQALLATPTLNLAIEAENEDQTPTPPGDEDIVIETATPLPTVSVDAAACVPEMISITEPQAGDTIRGSVEVQGTVDITDFGFYKFEVARAEEELWLTIQAGRTIVREGILVENWDTSRLPVGDYVLQLVVASADGSELDPCRIPVRIEAPEVEE